MPALTTYAGVMLDEGGSRFWGTAASSISGDLLHVAEWVLTVWSPNASLDRFPADLHYRPVHRRLLIRHWHPSIAANAGDVGMGLCRIRWSKCWVRNINIADLHSLGAQNSGVGRGKRELQTGY